MGIDSYNGGAVVAMTGKGCVAIASDHRMGTNFNTISRNNVKVHKLGAKTLVGLAGLETDNQTVLAKLKFRMKMFKLREEREMPAQAVGHMTANVCPGGNITQQKLTLWEFPAKLSHFLLILLRSLGMVFLPPHGRQGRFQITLGQPDTIKRVRLHDTPHPLSTAYVRTPFRTILRAACDCGD